MLQLLYSIQLYQYIMIFNAKLDVCLCAQSCPALCCPMDYSPPGSSAHGTFQARILEWIAISYSRGSSHPGIQLMSPVSPPLAGRFFTTEPHGKLKLDAYIISNIFSHHWPSCFYHICFSPLEYIDWNGIIQSKCDFKTFNTYWQIVLQNTSMYIFKSILKFWPAIYYQTLI